MREQKGQGARAAVVLAAAIAGGLGALACNAVLGINDFKVVVCFEGETRCAGNTPEICDADGQWQRSTPCDIGICIDGKCQSVGLPSNMQCLPGELQLESGSCQPSGVPPNACGEGFVAFGHGRCGVLLPQEVCPKGRMAIPGETNCREVALCGDGPWGEIPVEANTQFVDVAYAAGDSNGTAARPWTTIQKGIDEAEDGAIVAVAAGSYFEDVVIEDKAVRLWGRCPGLVEIRGTGGNTEAVLAGSGAASGTEIRSIAITGERVGISIVDTRNITIEQVWVHSTGDLGIYIVDVDGPTGVVLRASLVEQHRDVGVFVGGSDATIEDTVVRATQPSADGLSGRGIVVQNDRDTGERASVLVRASLVEQNRDVGVFVGGSDATIEDTVVRATQPSADGLSGWGIVVQNDRDTGERASVLVRASLVEQNRDVGVFVGGSDATIEDTVVRATQPSADGLSGWGIVVQNDHDTGERASVLVRASLVEQNRDVGVFVGGSDATIEATVVRATQPRADGLFGRGIVVQNGNFTGERANVTVRACLIEENHEMGINVAGSDAIIETTDIRGTHPSADGRRGAGIVVEDDPDTGERAKVTVRACLVEENHEMGINVAGSDAIIETTDVRGTQPSADGARGAGIAIEDDPDTGERADVTVRTCLVEQNQRIGVAVARSTAMIDTTAVRRTKARHDNTFGDGVFIENGQATIQFAMIADNARAGVANWGSQVVILDTTFTCNAFDLNGEIYKGRSASFDGSHGWRCTRRGAEDCAETDGRCYVATANLQPPSLPPPLPEP
ncbi:right-handed parallel beta-helix repeat-containing protein [Sorangium sp. So ce1389]|uniref:right-handed parallel beta-helix repeat-containing protein n=1 Tax=Sorangium sp. So ce1389 TaxID=3133336 RepID=UPI003F64862A